MKPGQTAVLAALLWCAPAQADEKLAEETGCTECHGIEERGLVGPTFKEIAARYEGQEGARSRLIETVTNGGKGNWREVTAGIPMPPFGRTLTQGQIGELVDWVLSQ